MNAREKITDELAFLMLCHHVTGQAAEGKSDLASCAERLRWALDRLLATGLNDEQVLHLRFFMAELLAAGQLAGVHSAVRVLRDRDGGPDQPAY